MKITPILNHGKTRWRVNIQKDGYRKRLFFASREEATAFAEATGGHINHMPRAPRQSAPSRHLQARASANPEPSAEPLRPAPTSLSQEEAGGGWFLWEP